MQKFLIVVVIAVGVWFVGRSGIKALFAGPYPPPVSKELYANEFRGSKAPEMNVAKWMTREPKLEGKVVMIDFWATWCGPCRMTIPEMNALQAQFKDDLVVIGLSDETPETIRAFMQQMPMKYAVGTDPTGRMKQQLGIEGIPNVFILSTDGVVRWQGIPMSSEDPLTPEVVKKIIEADPGVANRRAAAKH